MKQRTLVSPTLVLNKSWMAIRIEPAKRSFTKVFKGRAQLMDEEDFGLYDWEQWFETFGFRVPEIIVLSSYNKIPRTSIKLTRKNLMIRDDFTDQYTGDRLSPKDATIDHVIPRSRGGKNIWENVVLCHQKVNEKKGNRTPEDAGLVLLNKPKKPHWNPLYSKIVSNRPESWSKFINWKR